MTGRELTSANADQDCGTDGSFGVPNDVVCLPSERRDHQTVDTRFAYEGSNVPWSGMMHKFQHAQSDEALGDNKGPRIFVLSASQDMNIASTKGNSAGAAESTNDSASNIRVLFARRSEEEEKPVSSETTSARRLQGEERTQQS